MKEAKKNDGRLPRPGKKIRVHGNAGDRKYRRASGPERAVSEKKCAGKRESPPGGGHGKMARARHEMGIARSGGTGASGMRYACALMLRGRADYPRVDMQIRP